MANTSGGLLPFLRAILLVERYRATHDGAWPAALADCGEVPTDPWTERPLRFGCDRC